MFALIINKPSGLMPPDFFTEDDYGRGLKISPNKIHLIERAGNKFTVEINDRSHRKSLVSYDKHKPSVLVIGSSVAFGFGLNYKDSMIGKLEQKYSDKYNFINASSYAYGTFHALKTLEYECFNIKPKIVILVYEYKNFRNDFLEIRILNNINNIQNKPFLLELKDFIYFVPSRQFLSNLNLHPSQIIEKVIGLNNLTTNYKNRYLFTRNLDNSTKKNIDTVFHQINAILTITNRCNSYLQILITPSPYESYYGIEEVTTNYLINKLNGFNFIDLRLIDSVGKDYFLKGMDYPNEKGSEAFVNKINLLN